MLETLKDVLTRLLLQHAIIGRVGNLPDPSLLFIDLVSDFDHNVLPRNDVLDTDCETCRNKPVVDEHLDVRQKVAASVGSVVFPGHVDETSWGTTNDLLVDDSLHDLSLLDDHSVVLWVTVVLSACFIVGRLRDDQTQDLLSRPESLRLDDGRRWETLLKVIVDPH